jgi:hypothetical protein
MRHLLLSKGFVIGFACGTLPFVVANIYSFRHRPDGDGCLDCVFNYGIPFPVYSYGGAFVVGGVAWGGLLYDILLTLSVGIVIGMICHRFIRRKSFYA